MNNIIKERVPFSFIYDSIKSDILLSKWEEKSSISLNERKEIVTIKEYTDVTSGLTCIYELKEFTDSPAIEWVIRFRNNGTKDTLILEKILPLDIDWKTEPSKVKTLFYTNGSTNSPDDFMPKMMNLYKGESEKFSPNGGRSSDGILPFFNLQAGDKGCIIAVGWTGQWFIEFESYSDEGIKLKAGMENTHLKLYPGEEIRTPSIAMLGWSGDIADSHNLWRQFIIRHHTRIIDGEPLKGPLSQSSWGGMPTSKHLDFIKYLKEIKTSAEYYWMDAGWYGPAEGYDEFEASGKWYQNVGDWRYNPISHPDGLKPVAKAVKDAGMKFLLWVEPERAKYGTPPTLERPEMFLGERKENYDLLLNLGREDAREYIIELISGLISELDLRCYRQDFNMQAIGFWKMEDDKDPDRVGITEIKYIMGLYMFWDELLNRFPYLIIDNCASGGRRLDLETASRSIPLWRSDLQCFGNAGAVSGQMQTVGLAYWLPLNGTGFSKEGDTYYFRSMLSSALGHSYDSYNRQNNQIEWHEKMNADFFRCRPLYYGDYYLHSSCDLDEKNWLIYQMDRSDLGEGMIMSFRREKSPYTSANIVLKGVFRGAVYEIEDADTQDKKVCKGSDLVEKGINIDIEEKRASKLLLYKKI